MIDVGLDKGYSQLSVDAFITDLPGTQQVRLTHTGDYFHNQDLPPALGASVFIRDEKGHTYSFTDTGDTGTYSYTPDGRRAMVEAGNTYTLHISYQGEEYEAVSTARPAPPVDSILYAYKGEKDVQFEEEEGYYASFFAMDLPGKGDYYWIKSFRNGIFYDKPAYINLSEDGAFTNTGLDGQLFIEPIREGITPWDDPFQLGDEVKVELHAINADTYHFLTILSEQTNSSGLFDPPPANVPTNIKNTDPDSGEAALGWFNVAMVSVSKAKIE